jgi:hypothetical protein
MTDRDKEQADNDKRTSRHLEESISSGRITLAEADVIKLFFATEPLRNWPASNLQRRMQSSGG